MQELFFRVPEPLYSSNHSTLISNETERSKPQIMPMLSSEIPPRSWSPFQPDETQNSNTQSWNTNKNSWNFPSQPTAVNGASLPQHNIEDWGINCFEPDQYRAPIDQDLSSLPAGSSIDFLGDPWAVPFEQDAFVQVLPELSESTSQDIAYTNLFNWQPKRKFPRSYYCGAHSQDMNSLTGIAYS